MFISPNETVAAKRRTLVKLLDSTDLTGRTGKTGLGFAAGAAPAGCFVQRDLNGGGALVAAAGALVEISAANAPGDYYYEYTSAEVATNLNSSQVMLKLSITGAYLAELVDLLWAGPDVVRTGAAQAGGGNTITLDAGASATNNFYQWKLIRISGGAGAGQALLCTGYVGSTKVATVARSWVTAPDSTSTFEVSHANPDLGAQAIGSSTFATGAIDTNAVAAAVVTAIQAGLATAAGTHADAVSLSNQVAALPTAATIATTIMGAVVTGTITLQQAMQALLGAAGLTNTFTDQMVYDSVTGVLTGWRTRFYANAADATTVSGGGSATVVLTLIGTNTLTAGGKVATSLKVLS